MKVSKVQIEKLKTKITDRFIVTIFGHGFKRMKQIYADINSVPIAITIIELLYIANGYYFLDLQKDCSAFYYLA